MLRHYLILFKAQKRPTASS